MSVIAIPKALSDKLGDEGTDALAKVINEAGLDTRRELATKEDIAKLDGEIKLLRWMLGLILACVISLVRKAFFMH
ncbi:MAG: DUF1640 domain-containing protein [Nitrospirae bacterium]|nr:DUF1640 domain-containing protein [Nitrospirota bacterium]